MDIDQFFLYLEPIPKFDKIITTLFPFLNCDLYPEGRGNKECYRLSSPSQKDSG